MIKNVSGMRLFIGGLQIPAGATVEKLPEAYKASAERLIKGGLLEEVKETPVVKKVAEPEAKAEVKVEKPKAAAAKESK